MASKPLKLSLTDQKRYVTLSAGHYNSHAYLVNSPPGIGNTVNNCFANVVIQCLMNHPVFLEMTSRLASSPSEEQKGIKISMYTAIAPTVIIDDDKCL